MVDSVTEQLNKLILQLHPGLTEEQLDEDASLIEDLGLDSIMVVTLINQIEDHFAFTFDEEDLSIETFANIRLLAKFIESRIPSGER